MYLAACRKGQRNDRFRDQPFSRVKAPKREFSLKASYMRTILEFVRNSGSDMATNTSVDIGCLELVNTKELENKSFEDILTERLMEFRNLDYKQIARHFDIDISPKEKSKYAKAVKRILSDKLNKFEDAEEIRKAGIIVKTIRMRHNRHIRESMSFENIDYQEFMDTEDWTQSRWYEIITSRFMFIIFKEAEDGSPGWTDEKRYVLDRVLFWTMPEHDITIAEKYWEKHAFENSGISAGRKVTTVSTVPVYNGIRLMLGQLLMPEKDIPEEFFIKDEDLPKWRYLKGSKSETRKSPDGYEYKYSEGSMSFPDPQDKPSRTIITGEGGNGPSRFKHVVQTESGRFRRLTPIELERLNMFPDNHTEGVSDIRRAFLMGNALVTGIVEKIGAVLLHKIDCGRI